MTSFRSLGFNPNLIQLREEEQVVTRHGFATFQS